MLNPSASTWPSLNSAPAADPVLSCATATLPCRLPRLDGGHELFGERRHRAPHRSRFHARLVKIETEMRQPLVAVGLKRPTHLIRRPDDKRRSPMPDAR